MTSNSVCNNGTGGPASAHVSAPGRAHKPQTPCFVEGTAIATARGNVAVEDLRTGDLVLTRDNGYRPIRWIGARHFDAEALARYPELAPVRIAAGSIAVNTPSADLLVSPQHRMLLSGAASMALGGETEILASADSLVGLGIASVDETGSVTYYHILFDAHEIVLANEAWSESFNPAQAALDGLHPLQRREILTIFPELASGVAASVYPLARKTLERDVAAAA